MKKWIASLLAVALLAALMLSVPLTASADSLYIRKIVSVVYDDSTSMNNGSKWAYANYAMQTFCGMLNSEDQLYITYMNRALYNSNYTPEQIDLSAGGIQASVDSIRNHPIGSSTPFEAVQLAFNKLSSVQDSNPNTEYWLVVITDGEFNACQQMAKESDKQNFVDSNFASMYGTVMPNGSTVQITFLSIGDQVRTPAGDESDGLYKYHAETADGIIDAMSDMADRISGRTRLSGKEITQVDDQTIQVTSAIPLLNIAVLLQESNATMTGAVYSDERSIPISRSASLSYPGKSSLTGSAYLIGDSQAAIGAGTYRITFNQKVDLDNIVVLFEPALEMRMTVTVNGTEITDFNQLDDTAEGDLISISCGIYEMGTDKKVDPSLLPPGTSYQITVSEDGKVVKTADGVNMTLSDYELRHLDTVITATATIDGFNPIEYSVEFTPGEYVPKVVYTIEADYGSGNRSVKYDDIAGNRDMTVTFTVYADGVAMTDPEAVKALNPAVTASPAGNSGTVSYSSDGKIVFTPNAAGTPAAGVDSFDVDVTCTLSDGTTASIDYTVLMADYQVIAVGTDKSVTKTEFFGNTVGVSFYVTKDGVQLDKSAVESGILVQLNEEQAWLLTDVTVADDGMITVTPYTDQEHQLTFWNWWVNWYYYFGLSGEDVTVTMLHSYGSASSVIDVCEEDALYIILNVVLPLVIEVALLAFIIWWIYCIIAKPKFVPGTSIYLATLYHAGSMGNYFHEIAKVEEVPLDPYNKLKYRWKPTLKPEEITIGKGVVIAAGSGTTIQCKCPVWYKGDIQPMSVSRDELGHPEAVKTHIKRNGGRLRIRVLSPYTQAQVKPVVTLDSPKPRVYFVHTEPRKISKIDGVDAIEKGTIFAYARRQNH